MVRRRQGRARAVLRGRAGGDRPHARRSASRCSADLKLHDIPTTVGARGARARAATASRYLNFHAAGGVDDAARRRRRARGRRARRRARAAGSDSRSPCSRATPTRRAFDARLATRDRRGLRRRRVLGARGRAWCTRRAPDFVTIVPGVRLADGDAHDQARVGTPDARCGAPAPTCSWSVARSPRPTIRARAAQRRARRGRGTRSRRVLARERVARKPSPSCDATRSVSLCCAAADSEQMRADARDRRTHHRFASRRSISEEPHGEPAHAHTGAASARAREGRASRAASARR